jgi:hypothetical protein
MKAKLEALTEQIHFTIQKDLEQVEVFNRMVETQIFQTDITALKHKIFSVEDEFNIGTRKQNRMLKFESDLEVEFAEQGRNAWGLFNGVTRYTNHTLKSNLSYNNKMANIICGTGAKINAVAFEHITKYFSLN